MVPEPKDRPPEAEKFIADEVDDFLRLISRDDDLVPETLRFHLITENQINRLVSRALPRGEVLVRDARLRYPQKLKVLESLGFKDLAAVQALTALNTVRNACVHDRHRVVTQDDVQSIGSPLGDQFKSLRASHGDSLKTLTLQVYAAIFGRLSSAVYRVEHPTD